MLERKEMVHNWPTLGVFFDIDKLVKKQGELGTASYGFVAWRIIWSAVGFPNLRDGILFFDGDTNGTLNGTERVWCAAFQSTDLILDALRRKCDPDGNMIKSKSHFQEIVEQIRRTNRSNNLSLIRSSLENSSEFRNVAASTKFKEGFLVIEEPLPGSGAIKKGKWKGKKEYDSYSALKSLNLVNAKQWWQFWRGVIVLPNLFFKPTSSSMRSVKVFNLGK